MGESVKIKKLKFNQQVLQNSLKILNAVKEVYKINSWIHFKLIIKRYEMKERRKQFNLDN